MIASILISFKISFQEIRKEENFQDNEHDEKLDQNNQPHLFAPAGKIGETFDIKL